MNVHILNKTRRMKDATNAWHVQLNNPSSNRGLSHNPIHNPSSEISRPLHKPQRQAQSCPVGLNAMTKPTDKTLHDAQRCCMCFYLCLYYLIPLVSMLAVAANVKCHKCTTKQTMYSKWTKLVVSSTEMWIIPHCPTYTLFGCC